MTAPTMAAALALCIDTLTPANGDEEREAVEMAQLALAAAPTVEVSAWYQDSEGTHVCNDQTHLAQGFGVYVRNPLAMHLQDFVGPRPEVMHFENRFDTSLDAMHAAFTWADALAEHLGITVESQVQRDPVTSDWLCLGKVAPPPPLRSFEVPVTILATLTVIATDAKAAAACAREYVTESAPTNDHATGWNSAQPTHAPIVKNVSGYDVEGIDEIEETSAEEEREAAAVGECRAMLEARGYGVEGTGGGCVVMSRAARAHPGDDAGALVCVTDRGGSDFPTADDWLVCVYRGGEIAGEGFLAMSDDEKAFGLTQALDIAEATAAGLLRAALQSVPAA